VDEDLLGRFERQRPRLLALATRMLGSRSDAEDAVQEAWLRLQRSDGETLTNLDGWLTTVVSRVCLDALRRRGTRAELPLDDHDGAADDDPADDALLAEAVGAGLVVVLDRLAPAERVAFVLHDLFGVPFDEVGRLVGRSTDATKMLASRARRRVRAEAVAPDPDPVRQRAVVDAFLAASRAGDFDALVALLDPDVELRADVGASQVGVSAVIRGATAVAGRALMFARVAAAAHPVLVQGLPGVLNVADGRPTALLAWTVADGRIAAIHVFGDPERVAGLL